MRVQNHKRQFMLTRLTWMSDNQPDLLLLLYQEGELKQRILEEVESAKQLEANLEKEGKLHPDEIEEIVLNYIAPSEGMEEDPDREPAEITQEMFDKIVDEIIS
jgi:hypothetical protein